MGYVRDPASVEECCYWTKVPGTAYWQTHWKFKEDGRYNMVTVCMYCIFTHIYCLWRILHWSTSLQKVPDMSCVKNIGQQKTLLSTVHKHCTLKVVSSKHPFHTYALAPILSKYISSRLSDLLTTWRMRSMASWESLLWLARSFRNHVLYSSALMMGIRSLQYVTYW